MRLPTHDELIKAYQAKRATLDVSQINHREFTMDGTRYFCGYSSKRDPNYTQKDWRDPEYKVQGWRTYKSESVTLDPIASANLSPKHEKEARRLLGKAGVL